MTSGNFPLRMTRMTVAMVIAGLVFLAPARAGGTTEMLMFVRAGCAWCALWKKEIGPIYPKTTEGQRAPLREFDIANVPASVKLNGPVIFTPTFVVVHDGREVGRITGYPGQDFFWSLLSRVLLQVAAD